MQTLESIRKTIEIASDLQSVVKTMKTLAAVRIRQYEKAVEALDEYSLTIELGFQILLKNRRADLLQISRHAGPAGAIVFGSDQGMCGQFNEEIALCVRECMAGDRAAKKLIVVGARAANCLAEAGFPAERIFTVPSSSIAIGDLIQEIMPCIQNWESDLGLSRLEVFFNSRTTASTYQTRNIQLLPISNEQFREWSQSKWDSRSLPTYSVESSILLSNVIRQHLFVAMFRACAESLASENASRIAAMESAGKNIDQRLDELHDSFNQLRQQGITEELLDVVSGFEALSRERERAKDRKKH